MARGMVVIDKERCKGCGLCIEACPVHILSLSNEINRSGYNVVQVDDPKGCIGCAFCAFACPDIAIEVYKEKAKAPVK